MAIYPTITPPLDETTEESERQQQQEQRQATWHNFVDDVALDFAAFQGNIAHIQFSLTSNERERERYAAEKLRILSTMQSVGDNTAELRAHLQEAQRILALRKTYDEMTEKITTNRLLKPRDEQQANLAKLENEVTELQAESREYAKTWAERREQFGRILEEGMQLRRLIRDEKEEVERREGMQEGDQHGGEDKSSGPATPRPEAENNNTVHHAPPAAPTPLRQMIPAADGTVDGTVNKEAADTTTPDEGELEEGEEAENDRMDTT